MPTREYQANTKEEALSSLKQLNDVYFVQKLGDYREQIKKHEAEGVPVPTELLKNYTETVARMSRTEAFKA